MSSLTIRLDEQTDALLNELAERLQENKSSLARKGIQSFLAQQQAIEKQKQQLEQAFSVSSVDEVQRRVAESEASYRLSDEEYEQSMNDFFARELGLVR